MAETWRGISANIIHENFQRIQKEQPELTPEKILKIISREHYPFGQREYFPYKAWLRAMRDYKLKLGLISKKGEQIKTTLFG